MHLLDPSLRPFRMEAAWFLNDKFKSLVQESWQETNNSILEVIPSISSKASSWNKYIFGNIFRNKRWLLGRIEDIQKAQSSKFSHNLFILEKELVKDYNNVLYQEELLWFQKSRAKWITMGEKNIRNLSALCGIPLTQDLGKYLGIPLLHNRVSRVHFSSICDKLQGKLSSWKANMLSLAGRATLIKSVTAALPAYTMQTMKLPINHVLREGNGSADGLAKLRANQGEPLVVMDEALEEIRGLMIADMVGQGFLRP
ncbi:hypothetical protein ACSBR1_033599 [Camellia fascicularis]